LSIYSTTEVLLVELTGPGRLRLFTTTDSGPASLAPLTLFTLVGGIVTIVNPVDTEALISITNREAAVSDVADGILYFEVFVECAPRAWEMPRAKYGKNCMAEKILSIWINRVEVPKSGCGGDLCCRPSIRRRLEKRIEGKQVDLNTWGCACQ
jgi:hypothetical protein